MGTDELFGMYRNVYPEHAAVAVDCMKWGDRSIVIWHDDGSTYKFKVDQFGGTSIQKLSKDDIGRKFAKVVNTEGRGK